MSDDYELDDTICPKCGHSPTHSRRCINFACDDGWIDVLDFDDEYDGGRKEKCEECNGTGIERWCPKCGYDLQTGLQYAVDD